LRPLSKLFTEPRAFNKNRTIIGLRLNRMEWQQKKRKNKNRTIIGLRLNFQKF